LNVDLLLVPTPGCCNEETRRDGDDRKTPHLPCTSILLRRDESSKTLSTVNELTDSVGTG
jgi:hypothetical protein